MYSWRRILAEGNGNLAALSLKSRAPHQKRQPQWDQKLIPEIRRLRVLQPNLGKEKLFAILMIPFCEAHKIPQTSVSIIGRIIAKAPDKMRHALVRLGASSIQESFVDYHEDLLFTDIDLFNKKIADWITFYNTQLPHLSTKPNPSHCTSLNNLPIPPLQYLLKRKPECNMY